MDSFQRNSLLVSVVRDFCYKHFCIRLTISPWAREVRQPPHTASFYLFAAVRVPIVLPNLPQTVFREWSSIYNRNFYLKLIRLFKHGSPSIVSLEALWGYAPPQLGKMRFGSCVGEVAFPRSSKRPSYCVKYVGQLKCSVFMFIWIFKIIILV